MIDAARATPRAPSLGGRLGWSAIASALGLATSCASYVVIGKRVDPAEYGRFAVLVATWGLLSAALDWSGTLLMRYGPVELARTGSLATTISTRLVFTLPVLAVLLPGAPLYLHARGWPVGRCALTAAWLAAQAAFGLFSWSAVAAQRFRALGAANVVQRATLPVALLYAAAPLDADGMALATVGGTAAAAALLGGALAGLVGLRRPDRALLSAMWRYSVPTLIAAPSLAAMSYLDPLVLARSATHAEVGRYQLAYVTVTLFGALGGALNMVLSPELVGAHARGERATVDAYRVRTQPRLAVGLGLCAFAAACLVAPLGHALLPARYAGAAAPMAVLCVAGGFMLGVWSFHPLVTVSESIWALQIASMLSAVTNVAGDFWLAPRAGAVGVAFANVAAWAVQLAVLAALLHRRIGARRVALAPLAAAGALAGWLAAVDAPLGLRAAVAASLGAAGLFALRVYLPRRASRSRTA
jgi:O-antigen/teichoic acid export membrane protein